MRSVQKGKMNPSDADTFFMPIKTKQSSVFLLLILLSFSFQSLQAAVLSSDPVDQSLVEKNAQTESFQKNNGDIAKIIDVSGEVKLLKNGTDEWLAAAKGDFIEAGDQIITGASGSADIALDAYLLNITHISENTKAEFRSLKPTDIYMEDGSIYSALDGLTSEDGYQIATPTAVAAVRGTHFEVGFDSANNKFSATAVPTDDSEHQSRVLIHAPDQSPSDGVEITDGKELNLQRGQRPEQKLIRQADPAKIQQARSFLPRMGERVQGFQERRQEGKVHFRERQQQLKQPLAAGQGQPRGQRNFTAQNLQEGGQNFQGPQQREGSFNEEKNSNRSAEGFVPGQDRFSNRKPGNFDNRPGENKGFKSPQGQTRDSMREKPFGENRNFNHDKGRPMNTPQGGFEGRPNQSGEMQRQTQGNLKRNEGRVAGGPPPKKQ